MPKEKKLMTKEDYAVYFEAVGIFVMALCIIILAKLGKIGLGINIFFKLLFGDWSWILITGILYLAAKKTLFRKKINFSNIKLNGFALMLFSLMLLSHSSMYAYSLNFSSNGLKGIITIYQGYIENPLDGYMLGGGLIGAFFYQMIYFLLGEIGTLILAVLILLLSLIFLTGNSLFTFKDAFRNRMNKISHFGKNLSRHLVSIKQHKKSEKKVSINMLNDLNLEMNFTVQKNISEKFIKVIQTAFQNHHLEARFLTMDVGHTTTRYTFDLFTKCSIEDLKKILPEGYIYYEDKQLIMEFNNQFRELITIKRLIVKTEGIPLGVEVNNQIIPYLERHLLIYGSYDSGIRTFLRSFLVSLYLRIKNFSLAVIDPKEELFELKGHEKLLVPYTNKHENIMQMITLFNEECEKRMTMLNDKGYSNFQEYNQKEREKINKCFILINGYESIKKNNPHFENELLYVISMGEKCGLFVIIINRFGKINNLIKNVIYQKMVFKTTSLEQSYDIFSQDCAKYLAKKGEFFYLTENNRKRVQSGYVSTTDYHKIVL